MVTSAQQRSSLPSPASMLALQIVQAAVRPNVTVGELVALCQNDPAFVVRMLAYVNSAGNMRSRKVVGAQHAVSLLGVRGTRNLALATCVEDLTPKGADGAVLFALCLRRGIAAKTVAHKLAKPSADDYFTLGLLIEVGLLVKARDNLAAVAELARAPSATRTMLERAAGQVDHAKLGYRLAKAWHLDDETAMAIARHHEPEPPAFDLGAVAWLAERLSAVFEGGDVAANRLAAINAGAKLGLAPAAIDSMLSSIPLALQETAAQFHCNVGPQIDVAAALRDTTASLAEVNRRYNELMQHFGGVLQDKERLAGELQEASEKLTTLALNDGLTGLANHRAFQETLMRAVALADRVKAPLSLLIVDADNIKQVNDTYGHKTGDVVLVTLAEMLRASLRVSDLAARVGGDEFAILLPNTDEPGAKVVADRLRAKVAERAIRGPFGEFRVTVSLGVVATRGPGCKGREHALYEAAHKAVAAAKQAGRNRVQVVPS